MNPHVDKIWVGCCTRLHPNHPSPDSPDNQTWQGGKSLIIDVLMGHCHVWFPEGIFFFKRLCFLLSYQWAVSWFNELAHLRMVTAWLANGILHDCVDSYPNDHLMLPKHQQTPRNINKHQSTSRLFMTFQYIRQSQHSLTNHLIPKRFFLPSRHVGARPLRGDDVRRGLRLGLHHQRRDPAASHGGEHRQWVKILKTKNTGVKQTWGVRTKQTNFVIYI